MGEDSPKFVYPSVIYGPDNFSQNILETDVRKKRFYQVANSNHSFPADGMEIIKVFKEDGLVENWDNFEKLCDYGFFDCLRIDPSEYPIMFIVPPFTPKKNLESIVEIMVEKFNTPAIFLAKSHALSSFSVAKKTSLVIDSGYNATTVAAVYDGYVIPNSQIKSMLAGKLLTEELRSELEKNTKNNICPRHEFLKRRLDGFWKVKNVLRPHLTESHRSFALDNIIQDIKESVCHLNDRPLNLDKDFETPPIAYVLPDGTKIEVGNACTRIPEALFQPKAIKHYLNHDISRTFQSSDLQSFPSLVFQCINACEPAIRKELYANVVLTGGCGLFQGARNRL